jgi:hypothetical protein
MNTQFITDQQGNRTGVILSIEDYEHMLEQIEDTEDVKLYEAAKREGGDSIPLEEYIAQRKLKH